jgi:hypothetical protein
LSPVTTRALRYFFLLVDLGFVAYWLLTLLHWIPERYLFKDYHDPVLAAWNWSFLPLDLCVSATGLFSLRLRARGRPAWAVFALVSLVLTFCSGLQAIAFWVLRRDYDPSWWAPNLFLLVYPLFFVRRVAAAVLAPEENTARA